jgi:poly(beta-D-mannuronate) lyase
MRTRAGRSVWFEELPWDDVKVDYNNFYHAGRVQTFQGKLMGAHNTKIDPALVSDKNGFVQLPANSVLRNKASDGKNIGAK